MKQQEIKPNIAVATKNTMPAVMSMAGTAGDEIHMHPMKKSHKALPQKKLSR